MSIVWFGFAIVATITTIRKTCSERFVFTKLRFILEIVRTFAVLAVGELHGEKCNWAWDFTASLDRVNEVSERRSEALPFTIHSDTITNLFNLEEAAGRWFVGCDNEISRSGRQQTWIGRSRLSTPAAIESFSLVESWSVLLYHR